MSYSFDIPVSSTVLGQVNLFTSYACRDDFDFLMKYRLLFQEDVDAQPNKSICQIYQNLMSSFETVCKE